ncbi:immunoglobulin-like domain-containing protein [uncultured Clostridium sp.]|uniref:immunoglobulin-like domain-containing protein n=1 Tax=uncultured Clostridium sp. TaxID=59620 RepID=UPI00267088FB|nr:immunoglobulin-like domain-containing protein [uncultured Clostridium sp.]
MKKRLIIIVCIVILFIENLPEGIITSAIEKSIVGKNEKICSNYNNKIINNYDENIKGESPEISIQNNEEELGLDKVKFSAYINKTNDLLFSIGFNILEKKFTVENQLDKNISEETPEEVMYKIRLYDKEGKEKLAIELNGSDTGNSKKLEPLKNLSYEIGDFVQIIPVNKKDVLKITGNIQGDITKEKEDYLDGIDNYDYIENVRFEIADDHLNSIYNEAPVISGLNDIIDSENPNNDIFTGISVKDDHDGIIDNSKLEVEVIQLQDGILEVRYIAIDSWGRKTIGSRRIFPKSISKLIDEPENQEEQIISDKELPTPNNVNIENASDQLTQNEIIVEGTPYYDTEVRRFRLRFDTIANQIQIMDEDGRQMSNSINGEYFKFVLYDKDMNIKSSVTLLGTDKSDTDKLNDIRNYLFEEGDYVGIWHAESQDKLKINGDIRVLSKNSSGDLVITNEVKHYNEGVPQEDISTRRFRVKNSGLEEVINEAPQIAPLAPVEIIRGSTDFEPLNYIKNGKITDDFDEFTEDNLDSKVVSITYSPFDTSKVGEQIIVYTVTDSWGKSNTAEMRLIVKSTNPLDEKFIEFKNGDESLFKIKFDSVKNQFLVDDLDNVKDEAIDLSVSSSIFKLRIYTNDGVLQKTLNIKGTDNLRSMLKRFDGYQYDIGDCIELWSNNPKNIVISGVDKNSSSEEEGENGEDYSDGIDNSDFMKNVRFEIGESTLTYIYNEAPRFIINSSINLEVNRNGSLSREELMEGLRVEDDHDGNTLNEKVVIGDFDTNTIGEKEIEYSVVDSWGRSSMIKRKITVYPYSPLEYNYITIKNDETDEVILTIRFDDENKLFVVDKIDKSKVPSRLKENDKIFEFKLIKDNKAEGSKINGNNSESEEEVIISLTNSDLLNNEVVNKINNLSYKGFRYISLWCYDSKDGIFISGKSDIILNGFENEEKMENTRFEIKSEGLQVIYNEAPVIIGLNKILYVYKNDDITQEVATNGIEVKDDTNEISLSSIEITDVDGRKLKGEDESKAKEKFKFKIFNKSSDGYVETDEIRDFILNYKVTDAWGRSATYQRNVSVISKSASNDIEFYSADGNNKLFSINYNPISNIFDVKGSMVNEENFEEQQNEIVFKLTVFNVDEEKVGEIQLTEAESRNVEEIEKRLEDITVYDGYYFSLWSSNLVRLRINGYMTGNNELGEAGDGEQDYSQTITSNDYIDNVRFNLTEDGIHVIYNKPPKIRFLSNDILTVYAGDPINYTENIQVVDDRDNPENNHIIDNNKIKVSFIDSNEDDGSTAQGDNLESNEQDNGRLSNGNVEEKTEEEKFIEEEKKHLRIGNNTVRLTVQDSWGRESSVERSLIIKNGVDKNTIIFNGENGEIIKIGFNHENNKLNVITYNKSFGNGGVSGYVKIAVYRPNENGVGATAIVPQISIDVSQRVTDSTLQTLKDYTFKYGDYFEIYHGHPNRFSIIGNVTDERENYTDGVQNPENLLNVKFEITKSGLKSIYTNPDENNITNNKVVFGPVAPEKFPFKIQIDFEQKMFKVVDVTKTMVLSDRNEVVYKMVLIGSDGHIKKRTEFNGREEGSTYMSTTNSNNGENDRNWNNVPFEYNDCLYLWHIEPARSIIKGKIKNAREDYSDGVNDIDNMNNVVFRLTPDGLESIYNEGPKIHGAEDKDVYQGEEFVSSEGVTYTDDFDNGHLRTSISGDIVNTNQLGPYTVTYTATDRWDKTTRVNRKITVRPNLYKNIFKIFSEVNNMQEGNEAISKNESINLEGDNTLNIINSENVNRKLAFEIGFDTVKNTYKVFNQSNEKLSVNNLNDVAFTIEIKDSEGNEKANITLNGNDRGTSPKLIEINKLQYADGDIIRVYRSNLSCIEITGTIFGDKPRENDNMDDDNKLDYMKNTGFKVSNDGLIAKYNKAPNIEGVRKNRTISKGVIDLLADINVSDEIDENISKEFVFVYVNDNLVTHLNENPNICNYDFNKLGTYKVEYKLYDTWGRATLKEASINVESKVRENEIEVYGIDENLSFKIIFDTNENKFVLRGSDILQNETSDVYKLSENNYFEMVLRDLRGNEKIKVILNGDNEHDELQLASLNNVSFSKYDTISLKGETSTTVRIIGGVIIESNDENNIYSEKYLNGFGDIQNYSNVRFKITDDGLKEMTPKPLSVTGVDNITIKRGDTLNLLSGITVNVNDDNNEDYTISIDEVVTEVSDVNFSDEVIENGTENQDKTQFKKLREGVYIVKYIISNSWGTKEVINRTIKVLPRNNLENIKLNVRDDNRNNILIISFDSIQKKLRVLDYKLNTSINFIDKNQVFEINAYDTVGKNLGTIALRGNQLIDNSIISKINNFSYEEGYALSIWAKEPSETLELQGEIINSEQNKLEGLSSKDKMENGRFEILSNGLKYVYNEAPKIIGGDDTIPYYKGSLLLVPSDIEVTDDHDKISRNEVTINDDEVDYDTLGIQNITYIAEDSWGRSATKPGSIEIRSAMDSNIINIYSIDGIEGVSISFARDNINNQNKIMVNINEALNTTFNPNSLSDIFATIKIYDFNGNELKSVEILGNDNATTIKEKLYNEESGIQNFIYEDGQYIAIENVTELNKMCIKILGTVVNKEIDYFNGVTNIDKIKNVRFKFTDLGLEAVYNNAPVIQIDEKVKLNGIIVENRNEEVFDGIKGDDFNYLRGVKIFDDHDILTKSNVKVIWNPSNNGEEINLNKSVGKEDEIEKVKDEVIVEGEQRVGRNVLQYIVTDSWGRSNTAERIVNLKNGIFEDKIKFGLNDRLNLSFIKDTSDENSVKLNFTVNNSLEYFASSNSNFKYYGIKVYEPREGTTASSSSDYTLTQNLELMGSARPSIQVLGALQNMKIPYNTIIEIYAGHPQYFSINGPVRNAAEDYSDFVQNPENIVNTVFKITDSGLRAIYVEPEVDKLNVNENLIELVAPEKIPIKIKITPNGNNGGSIAVVDKNTTLLDSTVSTTVFTMELKSEQGNRKRLITLNGNQNGNDASVLNQFNDFNYVYGDTLTMTHRTPKKLLIKGNIEGARENYYDGVDNSLNLLEAVFKLTPNGLEAIYKSAPRIMGVMDKKVLKGTEINYEELKRSVTADDSIDGPLTNQIEFDYSDVNVNVVGLYEAIYTVTNSNSRTARKSSTIIVYDMPKIESTNKTIIELDSIDNKSEAINEYLKKAVRATDEDDSLYERETILELLSNDVNPSIEGNYKARYRATDLYGNSTEKEINIQVVRTINVTVPTKLPFQIVTNLIPNEDGSQGNDQFVSGVLKIKNNNTSPVRVKVESFAKKVNSGELEIVGPNSYDWDNMNEQDSMTKMALGIYIKDKSLTQSNYNEPSNPLWLSTNKQNSNTDNPDFPEDSEEPSLRTGTIEEFIGDNVNVNVNVNVINKELGVLPAKETGSDTPKEASIGFTSKHGKNFIGGSVTGKFELIFKFE